MTCLCCCYKIPSVEETANPIINIEKIIQDYYWKEFVDKKLNVVQRACVRRSSFIVDVPMHYFHIEQYCKPKVTSRHRQKNLSEEKVLVRHLNQQTDYEHTTDNKSAAEKLKKKKRKNNLQPESSKIEIATDFINDTNLQQTYKFRLEKTRKSTLNVTLQKGFSIGGKTNLTIGLPKLASGSKVSGEAEVRLNITKTQGDSIEETVTLETTSDINVKERSTCMARVFLAETEVAYDFTAWTKLSLPADGAPVTIRRRKDNQVCFSTVLVELEEPFEYLKEKELVKIREEVIPTKDAKKLYQEDGKRPEGTQHHVPVRNYVVLKSQGIVEGTRLSDQEIKLQSLPIKKNKSSHATADRGCGPADKTGSGEDDNGRVCGDMERDRDDTGRNFYRF